MPIAKKWINSTSKTYTSSSRSYIQRKVWEPYKRRILELRKENVRLSEIRETIRKETGFHATKAQYKIIISTWGDGRKFKKGQRRQVNDQVRPSLATGIDKEILKDEGLPVRKSDKGKVDRENPGVPAERTQPSFSRNLKVRSSHKRGVLMETLSGAIRKHETLLTQQQWEYFARWLLDFFRTTLDYIYEGNDSPVDLSVMPELCTTEAGMDEFVDILNLNRTLCSDTKITPVVQFGRGKALIPESDGAEVESSRTSGHCLTENPLDTYPSSIPFPTTLNTQLSDLADDGGDAAHLRAQNGGRNQKYLFWIPSDYWDVKDTLEDIPSWANPQAAELMETFNQHLGCNSYSYFLSLGRLYADNFLYDKAWRVVYRMIPGFRTAPLRYPMPAVTGCDDLWALSAMELAADLYFQQDDRNDYAIRLAEAIYISRKQQIGNWHEYTLATRLTLSRRLRQAGFLDRADSLLRSMPGIARKMWPHPTPLAVDIRLEIVRVGILNNEISDEAEDELLGCLSIAEQKFPRQLKFIGNIVSTLAQLYEARKDYDKSFRYYQRCLSLREGTYGIENPYTVGIVDYLVPALHERGLMIYSKPLAHFILKVFDKVFGPFHADLLHAIIQAARITLKCEGWDPEISWV